MLLAGTLYIYPRKVPLNIFAHRQACMNKCSHNIIKGNQDEKYPDSYVPQHWRTP